MPDPRILRESDLCDGFASKAGEHGWIVYPETAGWDLLLVRSGVQIGVQAKLRSSIHVLLQALPYGYTHWRERAVGPHYRAILVGDACCFGLQDICDQLKLLLFGPQMGRFGGVGVGLLAAGGLPINPRYLWPTEHPCHLPPVVPNGSGGVPSPSPLSRWKVGALRTLARCHLQGYVTSADAKAVGHDIHVLIQCAWLRDSGEKVGRLKKYVLDLDDGRPDLRHPKEFPAFLSEQRDQLGLAAPCTTTSPSAATAATP